MQWLIMEQLFIYHKNANHAIDFAVNWYKYNSYENAVKAWYIYKKWGIIMKTGKLN